MGRFHNCRRADRSRRGNGLGNLVLIVSGNNSVVECDLAKVEVAGSNPVSRSIFPLPETRGFVTVSRQGAVAKW